MAKAWLSINGLYNYDPHIFDDVRFPGIENAEDKQLAIDKILLDCAELPLIYTDPVMMRRALVLWSANHYQAWERILTALTEEYNPIHNYDRNETWTDTGESTAGVMGYNSTKFTDANKVNTGNTRTGHAYGNIGVTTSAQMIEQEIDIRTRQTMLDIVVDSFKSEFCVMVY